LVWERDFACHGNPRMRMDREPHIGEYAAKTNAICDCSQILPTPELGRQQARSGDDRM
jgi:hypothetical protein